ncbi:MAG: metal-dependent transcriptional regulator [Saprospiraceae bacterium]|nr:metal-dependent transcriptional regulator [Saprospiraceae bacterium]
MLSIAEENYLKAIYKILEKTGSKEASTKLIAQEMGTSSASVTDMIRKLNEKELLNYEKYYGVSFTKEGLKYSLDLIRKHRLWEYFLHTQLQFSWDKIHEIAEQLEHVKSEELIDRLDQFLDYPKYDPHGDPIPNKNGSFTFRTQFILGNLTEKNKEFIVLGVRSHDSEFLQYLDSLVIQPGRRLKILEYNAFDQSHLLQNEDHKILSISNKISNEILVKEL